MRFKTENQLRTLSLQQLEREKSRAQREMKSSRFQKDPERQLKVAKPTDPDSQNTRDPTLKQIEDYISQITKIEVEKNLEEIPM